MNRSYDQFKNISLFLFGGVGSSLATYYKTKQETTEENILTRRQHELLNERMSTIESKLDNLINAQTKASESKAVFSELDNHVKDLNTAFKSGKSVLDHITPENFEANTPVVKGKLENANEILAKIEKIIDGLNSDANKFQYDLSSIQNYLDSLSYTELTAFFHIIGCIVVILSIFSIILTLFGNELLNYLKLESKFPSLSRLIKLRLSMTKYYIS